MSGPVYAVRVAWHGQLYVAPVKALHMIGGCWAVGYVAPNGRRKKLTCRGNNSVLPSEEACIDRLRQLAAFRSWKDWPQGREEKCYLAYWGAD